MSSSRSGTNRLVQGHTRKLWESKFENVYKTLYTYLPLLFLFLHFSVEKIYSNTTTPYCSRLVYLKGRSNQNSTYITFDSVQQMKHPLIILPASVAYSDMLLPRKLGSVFSPSVMAKNHASLYYMMISTNKNILSCRSIRQGQRAWHSFWK